MFITDDPVPPQTSTTVAPTTTGPVKAGETPQTTAASGNDTSEPKTFKTHGGKGNPRNKGVESLANTIAKFQTSHNAGASN